MHDSGHSLRLDRAWYGHCILGTGGFTLHSSPIEDYALIGDCQTAALVARNGSIDWACFPRFDSGACFASLLGGPENGRWGLAPADGSYRVERRYEPGTLVLATDFHAPGGSARLLDFMPIRGRAPDIIRIVQGLTGTVPMHMDLAIRFGYGENVPWVTKRDGGLSATCGPDRLRVMTRVPMRGEDFRTVADFNVAAGESVPFVMTWYPSHEDEPKLVDPQIALSETRRFWQEWLGKSAAAPALAGLPPAWREAVERSLITLKAMTYQPTGGLVASVTTSLPEQLGGERNWDYRYCWLRDATLSLDALESAGYTDEVKSWCGWLLRAAAGEPSALQIMYGLAGERRLPETELPWLAGYAKSKPVRVGNAAFGQFQLDVYGEVLDALHTAASRGVKESADGWELQLALLAHLEQVWKNLDRGIWEVRGRPRQFTHSKVMTWVAFDRGVKQAELYGLDAPLSRWQTLRDTVHQDICRRGYDERRGTFVQAFDSNVLDASLLRLPLVGFLPATDVRIRRTIEAIEQHLVCDGLVLRYKTGDDSADGLSGDEGAFLICSFWLVQCLNMIGRHEDACRLFDRLLSLRNDVGLLAEEYDTRLGRQVGNFPQAFSHLGIVRTALALG